jgi:large subunit ribosomal protein L21
MYAVIDLKGHQYIVKAGDKIVVDRIEDVKEGQDYEIDKILLVFDGEGKDVKVGKPYLEGTKVKAKVVEHTKGDKIHVIKFKNKNRYSRKIGFRPYYTVLQIEDIVNG